MRETVGAAQIANRCQPPNTHKTWLQKHKTAGGQTEKKKKRGTGLWFNGPPVELLIKQQEGGGEKVGETGRQLRLP